MLFVGKELMPTIDGIRDRLTNVEHVIMVTPDGGAGDEYETWLAGSPSARPPGGDRTATTSA